MKIGLAARNAEIRRLRESGMTLKDVGIALGVTISTVWKVLHPRRRYRGSQEVWLKVVRAARERELETATGSRRTYLLKKQWNDRNPIKYRAHKLVEFALKEGRLTRQPCVRCGAERAHAHHDDYSRPLDVTWLCPTHHKQRHRELAASHLEAAA